jgi:hypothetical protein
MTVRATLQGVVTQLMDMGFSKRVAAAAAEMADGNLEAAFELCIGE